MQVPIQNSSPILSLRAADTLLEISPQIGGCISQYSQIIEGRKYDWLRPAAQLENRNNNALDMSSFPLVPFSNRIRNGTFDFQGQNIELPLNFLPERNAIHGHGWQAIWKSVETKENQATIEYQHEADAWPFPYLARQMFELTETELILTLEIFNMGKSSMPAGIGIHPYFIRTANSSIQANTKKIWFNDVDTLPLKLRDTHENKCLGQGLLVEETELDNIFTGWDHKVKITWPEWKAQLTMVADNNLDFLVVFTPANQNFFCVEPVSHVTDAFNMFSRGEAGSGTRVLKAGESYKTKISFKPELLGT